MQQDPGSMGSGRLPTKAPGLLALRQSNGGRTVGFPQLAVIDVPEILAGAEVGAEGLEPVAPVSRVALGAAPLNLGPAAVNPMVQVVDDNDDLQNDVVQDGHR
ncbi:MAG: hypothetical protein OXI92_19020, partial [Acidobacteriota bacterium]|nr:hypothetical protein [Acidobacteriota bacterium]